MEQMQTLKSLLEKGHLIINNAKQMPETQSLFVLEVIDIIAKVKKMEEIRLCKIEYIEQFILLFEQGILANKSEVIILMIQELKKAIKLDKEALKYQNIALKWLYWNIAFPLSSVALCNCLVKESIIIKLAENYFESISQRKISLNSKRLALTNYRKKLISEYSNFFDFGVDIVIDSKAFSHRKCEKVYQPYHIKCLNLKKMN